MISIHALLAESDFSHRESGQNYINFNPRSPCGERQRRPLLIRIQRDFNPRSPCGERLLAHALPPQLQDFNPRSPCGERPSAPQNILLTGKFQSTLSLRRATRERSHRGRTSEFQSTLSLRRATLRGHLPAKWHQISIHALLAESDPQAEQVELLIGISIHALLAESDDRAQRRHKPRRNFNPRSPCGERRLDLILSPFSIDFNPRSPCGERQYYRRNYRSCGLFQSTLSLRRATILMHEATSDYGDFNPRSPCGERLAALGLENPGLYFNPRSPCGERLVQDAKGNESAVFQSTLSLRRATAGWPHRTVRTRDFNPRSPCGERR